MAFSPDGVLLGVGTGSRLDVWDTREGDAMPSMDMKDGLVTALCFDRRRRYAAVGDDQGRIGVFATSDGSLLDVLLGHVGPVRSVQFDATSTRLVSGGDDTTVLAWLLELPDSGR